ncbi:MAG: argininosuccinate lyase [Candidatus Caldatribacteriaceae bacterium]
MRLWGSRMEKDLDQEVASFSTSIGEDFVFYRYDIWGSIAHCLGLEKADIIPPQEAQIIVQGLRRVYVEIQEGRVNPASFEDVHSLVEITLREHIGEVAGKLHTARSRNDQIVLDERLFLREETATIITEALEVIKVLLTQAWEYRSLIMPGYTHLQPAQPVPFSHHLFAYCFMLMRDIERLEEALQRIDLFPLGAGALAGTSLPIDRKYVASLLAFPKIQENSMDIVSDRDFILEFLADLSILALHLSRLGEEIVLWSNPHFGFVVIDDAFTTGSSIMPQKKNPDVAELVRGKAGEIVASFFSLSMTMKGLPLTYNRDLQQDKPPLLRATREMYSILRITGRLLAHITPQGERMREALREGFLTATDLCEYLVENGVPFRKAHDLVGAMVKKLASQGKTLRELQEEDLGEYHYLFGEELLSRLDEESSVGKKSSLGGASWKEIERELEICQDFLTRKRDRVKLWQSRWQESFKKLVSE